MKKFYFTLICCFSLCAINAQVIISQNGIFPTTKQLVTGEKSNPIVKKTTKAPTMENVTYSESFEGYQEGEEEWLPEGWDKQTVIDEDYGQGLTSISSWHASTGLDFMGIFPTDGEVMQWINFGYLESDEGYVFYEQDEWLISSSFTPQSGDKMYFDLYFAPLFMYLAGMSDEGDFLFDFENPTFKVRVYATTDDGKSWKKIWDANDLVDRYDDITIWDYLGDWETFEVALNEYAGEMVKIAFRYSGKDGDSIGLDNIVVGKEDTSSITSQNVSSQAGVNRKSGSFELIYPSGMNTVSVYSLSGKLMDQFSLPAGGQFTIPFTNYPKGVYIFKFQGSGTISIKSIN